MPFFSPPHFGGRTAALRAAPGQMHRRVELMALLARLLETPPSASRMIACIAIEDARAGPEARRHARRSASIAKACRNDLVRRMAAISRLSHVPQAY